MKYIAFENLAIRETEKPAIIVKNKPSNVDFGEECFELFVGGIMGHFFFKYFCSPSLWLFKCFCLL